MTDFNQPVIETKKIVRAFLIALAVGILLLVIAVLPAEYGIDLTGAGNALGFSKLYVPTDTVKAETVASAPTAKYRILKLENAGSEPDVKKPKEADNPPPAKQYDVREDTIVVTLPPSKGLEYKVYLLKYGTMKYEWITNEGEVFFDFHGEVTEPNPPKDVFYQSHTVSYSNNMIGTFVSPFEGRHGWYFKNISQQEMTVKIRLKGEYRLME